MKITKALTKSVSNLYNNERGNFTILTALVAFPLALGVTAAASYSNVLTTRARAQAAADAAALAATTALANGQVADTSAAQALALEYFQANAPEASGASLRNFTVVDNNNNITTKVNYSGTSHTLFSNFLGSNMSYTVSATAQQAVYTPPPTNIISAVIYSDPHILGGDASSNYQSPDTISCNKGNWINLFVASNIQINAQCSDNHTFSNFSITLKINNQYEFLVASYNYTGSSTNADYEKTREDDDFNVKFSENKTSRFRSANYNKNSKENQYIINNNDGFSAYMRYGDVENRGITRGDEEDSKNLEIFEIKNQYYKFQIYFPINRANGMGQQTSGGTLLVTEINNTCAAPEGALGQVFDGDTNNNWNTGAFEGNANDQWTIADTGVWSTSNADSQTGFYAPCTYAPPATATSSGFAVLTQ